MKRNTFVPRQLPEGLGLVSQPDTFYLVLSRSQTKRTHYIYIKTMKNASSRILVDE